MADASIRWPTTRAELPRRTWVEFVGAVDGWFRIWYHSIGRQALGRCEKLLEKARLNPGGLTFMEVCRLAECHGFVRARTRGSHHIFKNPRSARRLNFQSVGGRAKAYQVRQLLTAIERAEGNGE